MPALQGTYAGLKPGATESKNGSPRLEPGRKHRERHGVARRGRPGLKIARRCQMRARKRAGLRVLAGSS